MQEVYGLTLDGSSHLDINSSFSFARNFLTANTMLKARIFIRF